jgi:tRNA G18 (ribose-2'-O)-methylase SpoU
MANIILVAHNLRSCHNVGSLLRTADGLGVSEVYLTGYTPYPISTDDKRLPHLSQKINKQIHKTALGAEETVTWGHKDSVLELISELRNKGYVIAAVEQSKASVDLTKYKAPKNIALVIGREVEGIEPEVLSAVDVVLEIPMFGKKESFNVIEAATMAIYQCRFKICT